MVSYDDFAKLEVKIGTIKSVEVVEGADKLLRLLVDVGDTDVSGESVLRQIVSGIREYFPEPETLVGMQCPFLTNLQPRVIRGLESQGMILAVGDGYDFALMHPSKEVPVGTLVK